ncbi:hypothetical protein C7271_02465 [filamentous cyanobacterium CCP5]|nr:hypothetical protein C7271_02465 [filamentous cyanobacterium CCP5]
MLAGFCLWLWPFQARAGHADLATIGLIQVESSYGVEATADRFESILEDRGLALFSRLDHAAGAASVGQSLRPTELILFGNPAAGTPLMQCAQTVAIDLPQKALIWEDTQGTVWFGYNQPAYLQQRHQIEGCDPLLERITGVLAALADAATQPDEVSNSGA